MVIRRTDRVAEVLKRDEGLLEVFVAASPSFERLRNPIMRRTLGRLTTVEQAAQVAGIDPDELLARLNGEGAGSAPASIHPETMKTDADDDAPPPALARIPAERVVDLDVREELRNGQEPFSRIMAARRQVPEGGALRLRAIFEPAPLYVVMAKQGFDHWTEQLAQDDWRVTFYESAKREVRSAEEPLRTSHPALRTAEEAEGGEGVVVLDVRGMEPPEPMVRTLAALEELPAGATLLQINERVPQFLLPRLEELGFGYQVREQSDALVRVFIRRRDDS